MPSFPIFVLTLIPIICHASPINRQVGISENVFMTTQNGTDGLEHRVCSIDAVRYLDGETIPTSSPCEHCVCRPPGFACTITSCEYRPGCKAFRRSDQCCPEYQCECEKDGKIYQNGEKIMDNNNPCEVCYCQGGEIICAVIDCYWRNDCPPRYIDNRCCPMYDHCPPPSAAQGPIRHRLPSLTSPISWLNVSQPEPTSQSPLVELVTEASTSTTTTTTTTTTEATTTAAASSPSTSDAPLEKVHQEENSILSVAPVHVVSIDQSPLEVIVVNDIQTSPVPATEIPQQHAVVNDQPAFDASLNDINEEAPTPIAPTVVSENLISTNVLDSTTLFIAPALVLTIAPTSTLQTVIASVATIKPQLDSQIVEKLEIVTTESILIQDEPVQSTSSSLIAEVFHDLADELQVTEKLPELTEKPVEVSDVQDDIQSDLPAQEDEPFVVQDAPTTEPAVVLSAAEENANPTEVNHSVEYLKDESPARNDVTQQPLLDDVVDVTTVAPSPQVIVKEVLHEEFNRKDLVDATTPAVLAAKEDVAADATVNGENQVYADVNEATTSALIPENYEVDVLIDNVHLETQHDEQNQHINANPTVASDDINEVGTNDAFTIANDNVREVEENDAPTTASDHVSEIEENDAPTAASYHIADTKKTGIPTLTSNHAAEIELNDIPTPASDHVAEIELNDIPTPASDHVAEIELNDIPTPASDHVVEIEVNDIPTPASDHIAEIEVNDIPTPAAVVEPEIQNDTPTTASVQFAEVEVNDAPTVPSNSVSEQETATPRNVVESLEDDEIHVLHDSAVSENNEQIAENSTQPPQIAVREEILADETQTQTAAPVEKVAADEVRATNSPLVHHASYSPAHNDVFDIILDDEVIPSQPETLNQLREVNHVVPLNNYQHKVQAPENKVKISAAEVVEITNVLEASHKENTQPPQAGVVPPVQPGVYVSQDHVNGHEHEHVQQTTIQNGLIMNDELVLNDEASDGTIGVTENINILKENEDVAVTTEQTLMDDIVNDHQGAPHNDTTTILPVISNLKSEDENVPLSDDAVHSADELPTTAEPQNFIYNKIQKVALLLQQNSEPSSLENVGNKFRLGSLENLSVEQVADDVVVDATTAAPVRERQNANILADGPQTTVNSVDDLPVFADEPVHTTLRTSHLRIGDEETSTVSIVSDDASNQHGDEHTIQDEVISTPLTRSDLQLDEISTPLPRSDLELEEVGSTPLARFDLQLDEGASTPRARFDLQHDEVASTPQARFDLQLDDEASTPRARFDLQLDEVASTPQARFDLELDEVASTPQPRFDLQLDEVASTPQPRFDLQLDEVASTPQPRFDLQHDEEASTPQPRFDLQLDEEASTPQPRFDLQLDEEASTPQSRFDLQLDEAASTPQPRFDLHHDEVASTPQARFDLQLDEASTPQARFDLQHDEVASTPQARFDLQLDEFASTPLPRSDLKFDSVEGSGSSNQVHDEELYSDTVEGSGSSQFVLEDEPAPTIDSSLFHDNSDQANEVVPNESATSSYAFRMELLNSLEETGNDSPVPTLPPQSPDVQSNAAVIVQEQVTSSSPVARLQEVHKNKVTYSPIAVVQEVQHDEAVNKPMIRLEEIQRDGTTLNPAFVLLQDVATDSPVVIFQDIQQGEEIISPVALHHEGHHEEATNNPLTIVQDEVATQPPSRFKSDLDLSVELPHSSETNDDAPEKSTTNVFQNDFVEVSTTTSSGFAAEFRADIDPIASSQTSQVMHEDVTTVRSNDELLAVHDASSNIQQELSQEPRIEVTTLRPQTDQRVEDAIAFDDTPSNNFARNNSFESLEQQEMVNSTPILADDVEVTTHSAVERLRTESIPVEQKTEITSDSFQNVEINDDASATTVNSIAEKHNQSTPVPEKKRKGEIVLPENGLPKIQPISPDLSRNNPHELRFDFQLPPENDSTWLSRAVNQFRRLAGFENSATNNVKSVGPKIPTRRFLLF